MNSIDFTFSDTIAGYVTTTDWERQTFGLKTSDGREYTVKLTETADLRVISNPGEAMSPLDNSSDDPIDAGKRAIVPGRYLFACGIYYPENDGYTFEAKHLIFPGDTENSYRFEEPDWWTRQIRALAEFYLHAQFPDGQIDFANYRTHLTVEGQKVDNPRQERDSVRQETATISRMIYGFATAYMLTGEERYLEAAEKGTAYLREHMRAIDEKRNLVYWYHAMDIKNGHERKIFASEADGGDYNAIPIYEQIYALAGPVQTYRVTGDPAILEDAQRTLQLFNCCFRDERYGGYFSHLDPVTFNPRDPSLGGNQARKNWNSIGDHIPAYLINLWLATGENSYADLLAELGNLLVQHCPDESQSPFMLERFHEDWSPDLHWGWQQNRAVVGHNLKLAWNLLRVHNVRPNDAYIALARKVAAIMPGVGMDRQRGAWYDVVERERKAGEGWYRFVYSDRKAWWQQEQAILAYLILSGVLQDPEYLRLARESESFYNAFFPDRDNQWGGGVYFNVLADGIPYLLGNERLKGNHAMSGYHAFELCYLATVYTNLLINKKQPMNLYFKPKPGGFKDNLLRVLPDILPPGAVHIGEVWINGQHYDDFDAEAMIVRLPSDQPELRVRVSIVPKNIEFTADAEMTDGASRFILAGDLNDEAVITLQTQLERIVEHQPHRIDFYLAHLRAMSDTAARALAKANARLPIETDMYQWDANEQVERTLRNLGLGSSLHYEHTEKSTSGS